MHLNCTFELSIVLDTEKFQKVFTKVYNRIVCMERNEEYIDQFMASKGIAVVYCNNQYKKKVKLIVNSNIFMGGEMSEPDKFIRKLDKRIGEYFGYKYKLDDFILSGMILTTDIDVGNHENAAAYLKVLKRIGKVKGFSPVSYECFDNSEDFCLDGNSNGIAFLLYDLEGILREQLRINGKNHKKLMIKESEGILRTEVRLTKPKAIRTYTTMTETSGQIAALLKSDRDIFLDTFTRIVPFGNFYKKDKAEEIIRRQVEDSILRRKMLRLLALIPDKKSLYLAQKAMNCRSIEKVMDGFAKINVSPITISKRHDVKYLRGIYFYLEN